jgi:hypothetical protein
MIAMGLNLLRERFRHWIEEEGLGARADFLAKLEKHLGKKIDVDAWQIQDKAFPRVGSYTAYDIFRLCLQFVAVGDFEDELDEEDDVELEALKEFRALLAQGSLEIPYASHFLETGDSDTIFIPLLFARPFVYDDRFVASLPGGVKALQAFAKGLQFEVSGDADVELEAEDGRWLPVATAKNVARILYGFFAEKPDACVALS